MRHIEITPILDGGHNWHTADEHMRQTLPRHWSALGPSTVYPFRIDSVTSNGTANIVVHGLGVPQQSYNVQTSQNLGNGFQTITITTADAAGNLIYQEAVNAGPKFYRFAQQ